MNSAEDLVKSWKNEKKKKVHLVFMLNSQRQERFLFFPILIHSVSFESVVSPLVPKTKKTKSEENKFVANTWKSAEEEERKRCARHISKEEAEGQRTCGKAQAVFRLG